uniref:RanBP2-type domain-containing protein n=1 Tax=Skeletonema marinoi TaxID=267567 RepID=A0A7S2PYH7_9STRA|mmetsp:Transcript_4399/g.7584  ORF Transcript_4399/g.7584 Transcript_4399/m.7584 type:complete len:978 (+) Transcript_4399:121-3054(+)
MNYSGAGGGSGNATDGWEALLLNSFYGTLANPPTADNNGTDNNGDQSTAGGMLNDTNGATSTHGGGYDPTSYAAYLQNNYTTAPPPPSTNNYYNGGGAGSGSVNNPLNYNGGGSGGYSLTMPASPIHQPTTTTAASVAGGQYNPPPPPPINNGGEHHHHPQSQYLQYETATAAAAADPFADYNAYFNNSRQGAIGMQQQQQQHNHYAEEFCDALLQGLDEPSLNSLHQGVGGGALDANFNSYQQQQQQQPFTTMRGNGGGGMYMDMGGGQSDGHQTAANSYTTNMYMTTQQQPPPQPTRKQPSRQRSSRSKRASTTTSSTTISSTTSSSNYYRSPNETDHSSQPVQQIDPLLETITLKVSSVSLNPLSGNQVVTHIRTKTDDVTTRFIPCVDFLVNCQQELRQGLQVAQRRRVTNHGRGTRTTQNMTPRQFHNTYVAPLPRRFERSNQSIMAREYLTSAKGQLQQLVKESAAAIPQGCDHVKNAFLGGMRENESWGLRKWLSKHGGAGSICNDLEEVMRTVKNLKKEELTTKRLAEMLRPIASQAHERLKKDVPQAYQEQSSAHPYLPFFHRLEACLKQMATYDPEDDDVICLEDSEDEEDVVAVGVASKKCPMKSSSNSAVESSLNSTPVKRRSDYNDDYSMEESSFKRSKPDGNEEMMTTTKSPTKKGSQEIICLDSSSDEEEEDDDEGRTPPPQAAMPPAAATTKPLATTKTSGPEKWRCSDCTFLNSASSARCEMCQDDNSDGADELANFLGGSFLVGDGSGHASYPVRESPQSTSALQAADARELECLAQHISLGGNLPLQALQHQKDRFWGAPDKFPRLLALFRTIIQHPSSHRFVEPVNESRLFVMGMPSYTSVVKYPICFHAIVLALSRSEDAVTYPHLSTRLANGVLGIDGLQDWNMWNGLHLIEAIDLVFLNALAYDGNDATNRSETELLRKVLWDGVNSILKSLQPHERKNHLPSRRDETSSFVIR